MTEPAVVKNQSLRTLTLSAVQIQDDYFLGLIEPGGSIYIDGMCNSPEFVMHHHDESLTLITRLRSGQSC